MGDSIEKKKIGDYKIKIYPDTDPSDPRGDYNLGTMVCFHSRYNLGDKHDYRHADYSGWRQLLKQIDSDHNVAVILPLYLYDHSGITMNTTGFSCPWDSGMVGFIFVSKKKVREEYGYKYITKKVRERITGYLESEVKVYDQYLTGDIYGYKITKKGEELDSCWGYYGQDECMKEAESIVEYYINKEKEEVIV
jgi:hypothetical protein